LGHTFFKLNRKVRVLLVVKNPQIFTFYRSNILYLPIMEDASNDLFHLTIFNWN